MIVITAKQLNPNVRVVARCQEVRNMRKMQKAGADSIVSPDFTGGMRIASAMIRPHVVGFLDEMLKSDKRLRLEEVPVPDDFPDTPVQKLRLRSPEYKVAGGARGARLGLQPATGLSAAPRPDDHHDGQPGGTAGT